MLDLAIQNLLSPPVLAFALGLAAIFFKSDLKLPDGLLQALTIYLLFAIGLKGGAALSQASLGSILLPSIATLAIGIVTTFTAFGVAKWFCKLDHVNACALAAHYGSVSAVTFIAAVAFVQSAQLQTEAVLPALVAVLEIPAILIALYLARGASSDKSPLAAAAHLFRSKTVFLLVGGVLIGALSGQKGIAEVSHLFVEPFKGALTIFLLELGILAGRHLSDVKTAGVKLVVLAIALPVVHCILGVALAHAAGMSVGGAAVMGAMSASASYIAAPAVVRSSLPTASPGLYLTGALGITFPFNLTIGIPLALWFSRLLG